MISRAVSLTAASKDCPAKNTSAVSRMANTSARNGAAISANSTAAVPPCARAKHQGRGAQVNPAHDMPATANVPRRGRFISFEGVDGAGKSTQVEAVAAVLRDRALPFVQTREPGGTPLGEKLRALGLGQDMAPLTETLLMFAARNEHLLHVIVPALAAGTWILCDRFADASYAYQGGGRGVPAARIDALCDWVVGQWQPDLTVLVDVDPAEAQRRRARVRAADRFERESEAFFDRVRAAYLARLAAQPARFLLVDGSESATAVTGRILQHLAPWLD